MSASVISPIFVHLRKIPSSVLTWLGVAVISLTACSSTAVIADGPYTVDFDVPYVGDGNPRHVADMYVPQGVGSHPAILLIHGGGWARGEREDVAKYAKRLVRAGYVVMNLTYRVAPEYRFPAQTQDVAAAHAWLLDHANQWKVDIDRIGTFGYSAGGHLALMHALLPDATGHPIKAAVSGAGPTDVTVYPDSPYLKKLIGGTPDEFPQEYMQASPISYVSTDDPPIFMYHGTWDQLVEVEQSRALATRLRAEGLTVELVETPLRGHVTNYLFDGYSYARAEAFLDQHVKAWVAPLQ